jgi:Helix-turn-helix domain
VTSKEQRRPGKGASDDLGHEVIPKRNKRRKPRRVQLDDSAPPFAMVPTEAFADRNLTESELRVFGAICSFRNAYTGYAFPTIAKLMKRTNLSRTAVKDALRVLERRKEYIEVLADYSSKTGARRSNVYIVTLFDPSDSEQAG